MVSFDILHDLLKEHRSTDDYLRIHEWLKRKTDIFKNLAFSTVIEILKSGKIIEKNKNEIIIRQGDIGDSVYVMIKGSASIYINTDINSNQAEEVIEASYSKKLIKSAPFVRSGSSLKAQKESLKIIKNNDRKLFGEFTGKLDEGCFFGELALIQTDCIRNASIISDEIVYILSINRDSFNHSLRSFTESLYQDKVNFVNNCFLFKTWMPRLKYQIAMSLVKETFYFGQKLIVQGQESGGLIFLKKGEAKVIIDIKQHRNQYKLLIADQLSEGTYRESTYRDLPGNNKLDSKINLLTREVTKNIKTDEYEVAILGENYIIGDIEFCFDIYDNIFTVIATKNCEVYILGQAHLDRMINQKRNITTFNIIQDLATLKLNIYYNRCSIISELPLLKYLIEEINKSNESEISLIKESTSPKKFSFQPIFPPGPVIDLFGPGSVFFRNRSKRKAIEARLAKSDRSKKIENWNSLKILPNNNANNENNISKSDQYLPNIRKSIHHLSLNKNNLFDWETSSEHLGNLESRLNTWMLNIPVQSKSYSNLSNNFTILKLPRFKSHIPLRSSRITNTKEISNDKNVNDIIIEDGKHKGEKGKLNNKDQKIQENITRQYSIMDYRRLKKEMYLKEKKLAVFRLTNAI